MILSWLLRSLSKGQLLQYSCRAVFCTAGETSKERPQVEEEENCKVKEKKWARLEPFQAASSAKD